MPTIWIQPLVLIWLQQLTVRCGDGCINRYLINKWIPNGKMIISWYQRGHLMMSYRQVSNIRCTLVGNNIVDHSVVVGVLPVGDAPTSSSFLTPGFNGLGKDNCTMRRETFKFGELVQLILEIYGIYWWLEWDSSSLDIDPVSAEFFQIASGVIVHQLQWRHVSIMMFQITSSTVSLIVCMG